MIQFADYAWQVKSSEEMMGPGPNYFSSECARIQNGTLNLQVFERNGKIYCGEVILSESLGYGKYYFFVASRIDLLASNLVLGLFTWSDTAPASNCEIDIECSKWDGQTTSNMQYVVQPPELSNHLHRFGMTLDGTYTTHIIDWRPDEILFQSLYGHYLEPPTQGHQIQAWRYAGCVVPDAEHIHINLWRYGGRAIQKNKNSVTDVTIKHFLFQPHQVA
jgi:hypothetical protein